MQNLSNSGVATGASVSQQPGSQIMGSSPLVNSGQAQTQQPPSVGTNNASLFGSATKVEPGGDQLQMNMSTMASSPRNNIPMHFAHLQQSNNNNNASSRDSSPITTSNMVQQPTNSSNTTSANNINNNNNNNGSNNNNNTNLQQQQQQQNPLLPIFTSLGKKLN